MLANANQMSPRHWRELSVLLLPQFLTGRRSGNRYRLATTCLEFSPVCLRLRGRAAAGGGRRGAAERCGGGSGSAGTRRAAP